MLLWFAFKLYLYQVLSHPVHKNTIRPGGCDLLSNCIFIKFYHIRSVCNVSIRRVVICFQIVSLSSSITSSAVVLCVRTKLWFAFKLYLYQVLSHRRRWLLHRSMCCDLLSNCIFIKFYHIICITNPHLINVVICFQIVSLSSSITSQELYYYLDE